MPSDYASQRVIDVLTEGTLANGGLSYADVQKVPVPNVVGGANEFEQGKADVFLFALGSGKVAEVNSKVAACACCRSITPRKRWSACASSFRSPMRRKSSRARASAGVDEPTWVYAYDYLVLVNDKVADDVVYTLTKLLHDHQGGAGRQFRRAERLRSQAHEQGPGPGEIPLRAPSSTTRKSANGRPRAAAD